MPKVGRNDPCPCGSGKKSKHCCAGKASPGVAEAGPAAPMMPEVVAAPNDPLPSRPQGPPPTARQLRRVTSEAFRRIEAGTLAPDGDVDAALDDLLAREQAADRAHDAPQDQALDLVDQAVLAAGRRQAKLLRQAIAVDPDCAEAYVLLGDAVARNPEEALGFYEQGVAAAGRRLAPGALEAATDALVLPEEAAAYLEARFGVVRALAVLDRRQEAVAIARDLLRLNPIDDQGVRFVLLAELLELGQDAEADAVIRRYPNETLIVWPYTRALVKFRLHGDAIFARHVLTEAIAANPAVLPYLLGDKRVPKPAAAPFGWDEADEARWYAAREAQRWRATPGAVEWLRLRSTPTAAPAPGSPPQPSTGDEAAVPWRAGPALLLNPYPEESYDRCPECGQPTTARRLTLGLLVEPGFLEVIPTAARSCRSDDILFVQKADLDRALATQLRSDRPAAVDNEYVVLGLLDPERPLPADEETDFQQIVARLQGFRDRFQPEDFDPLDWTPDPLLGLAGLGLEPPVDTSLASKAIARVTRPL